MMMRATICLLALGLASSANAFSVNIAQYYDTSCSSKYDDIKLQTDGSCQAVQGYGYFKITTNAAKCSNGASITIKGYVTPTCSGEPVLDGDYTIGQCVDVVDTGFIASCPSSGSDSCFPAEATVELEDGTTKTMAQLAIGDRVRTGSQTFSDVHFFSHDDAESVTSFVVLTLASGHKLALTSAHYVPLASGGNLTRAADLRVGHQVQLGNGNTTTVVAIATERRTGLYNPHTVDGSIVVDGVVTSCYTGSVEPTLAHALLWPLRTLYAVGVRVDSVPANEQLRSAVLSMLPKGQ